MLTRRIDSRERAFNTIPISYLVQTANQFYCDIFVTSDRVTANVKHYDEIQSLRLGGFLTFYFKGSDESEARERILRILLHE